MNLEPKVLGVLSKVSTERTRFIKTAFHRHPCRRRGHEHRGSHRIPEKGPQSVDEAIERETLEGRLAATYRLNQNNFRIQATSTLYTNVVEVRGKVVGSLSFECSRCGETLEMNVDTPFHHSFVPQGRWTSQMPRMSRIRSTITSTSPSMMAILSS